jgi:hypothetical protein
VLSSDDPAYLVQWSQTECGSDDPEIWAAAAARLPGGSASHTLARIRLADLDRELGTRG